MLIVLSVSTLLYLFAVQQLTLTPAPYDDDTAGFITALIDFFAQHQLTAWLSFNVIEFLANVALFVPFAVLMWLWLAYTKLSLSARSLIIVASALLSTGMIELSQHLFFETRVADPRDIVANTLGAILGVLGCWLWHSIRNRRKLRA